MPTYMTDATGHVKLAVDGVFSPLLAAVFSIYAIDGASPLDAACFFIRQSSEEVSPTTESLYEALESYADQHEVFDYEAGDIDSLICAIARRLGREVSPEQSAELRGNSDEGQDLELDAVVAIARLLDDGHRIESAWLEAANTCSRPVPDGFGGWGCFVGKHATVWCNSSSAFTAGTRLDDPIEAGDTGEAAEVFVAELERGVQALEPALRPSVLRAPAARLSQLAEAA